MKKILLTLISMFSLLAITSCGNTDKINNNSNGSSTSSNEVIEEHKVKHEVVLNNDNFKDYFDYNVTTSGSGIGYRFEGCLSYAYYENVIVTFKDSSTNNITLNLNVGGNGYYRGNGTSRFVSITGKVYFWF